MKVVEQSCLMIKNNIKSNTFLCIWIVFLQIISIVCIFMSLGLIYNAYLNFEDSEIAERYIYVTLETDNDNNYSGMYFNEFLENYTEITKLLNDNMQYSNIHGKVEINGKSINTVSVFDFQGEDSPTSNSISINKEKFPNVNVGDDVIINNISYHVINDNTESADICFFDANNTPSSVNVTYFDITCKELLPYELHKKVENKIIMLFDPIETQMPETPKLLDVQMNNTQITISVILIIIVVLNCSLCYKFIYQKRQKTIAIYRIWGANLFECTLIYLIETLVYMLISFMLSYTLFDKFIKSLIIETYPKAAYAYNLNNYLKIFSSYFIITLFVMLIFIVVFIKKPLAEERK